MPESLKFYDFVNINLIILVTIPYDYQIRKYKSWNNYLDSEII